MSLPGFDLGSWDQPLWFAPGIVAEVGSVLETLGRRRPLVVCSWRRQRSGGFAHLAGALGATPRAFVGVEAHVPRPIVIAAFAEARAVGADAVISFGGGAAHDLGKAVVYLAAYGTEAFDAAAFAEPVDDPPIVQVAVPTTYSGAEATRRTAVSEGTVKRDRVGPGIRPAAVVADPDLTLDLPPRPTAGTAFTALGHCLEGLWVRQRDRWTDPIAERAAAAIVQALPAVDRAPGDREVRETLLGAAYAAGVVLDQAGGAIIHALCAALGPLTGAPHGMANAILVPHVLRAVAHAEPDAGVAFARAIGTASAAGAADRLHALAHSIRLPARLREVGVFEQDLGSAAKWVAEESVEAPRGPVPVSEGFALDVLRAAW